MNTCEHATTHTDHKLVVRCTDCNTPTGEISAWEKGTTPQYKAPHRFDSCLLGDVLIETPQGGLLLGEPLSAAEQQAAAFRKLADFLEANPRFAVTPFYADGLYLWHIDEGRGGAQTLADMIYAAHSAGAQVIHPPAAELDNACSIALDFGGICAVILTYRQLLDAPITDPDPTTAADDSTASAEL